ncbi:GGDEF domain-containing protein [Sphingomonas abaci]|uniref:Diguanylate cyclase (GGDEF)-like protein n=1 Tax=Sphingomonas abaci TaxID=237611 RepID=A0A7W7AGA0_9SPHN|nr:diguanylate cyclase (GGDEF)-like protein [Sphingomonas abaci]
MPQDLSATAPGRLPDATYVELVSSLFATRAPTVIMSLLFLMAGMLVAHRTQDPLVTGLVELGTVSSMIRIALLFSGRMRHDAGAIDHQAAVAIERRFAVSYVAFAIILGLFVARTMQLPDAPLHTLAGILLVGYAAGVAAGTALRPRIAVASLLVAVLPPVAVLFVQSEPADIASAVALGGFLAGGMRSLLRRYRTESASTAKRHGFAALARRDHLTGLANRLELAERFDRLCTEGLRTKRVAIHYLDLDDFKPVNDRLGHPTGDALLRAVAGRLRDHIRGDDIAARLGGDEFVVVQTAVRDEDEVAAMARRLERDLAEPYAIDGREIVIGASVGWCLDDTAEPLLDPLLERADDALRRRKAERKAEGRAPVGAPTAPSGSMAGSPPGSTVVSLPGYDWLRQSA